MGHRVLAGLDSDRLREVRRSRDCCEDAEGLTGLRGRGKLANAFEGVRGVVGEAAGLCGGEEAKLG